MCGAGWYQSSLFKVLLVHSCSASPFPLRTARKAHLGDFVKRVYI